MVVKVGEAEMDEMWSFVQSQKQQRWLWHTIGHRTGAVLADVLAPSKGAALKQLQQLLGSVCH
jgi:insertion element IS1 protein InsB